MMLRTHSTFGCIPTDTVSRQSHCIIAFAETGAQTYLSGTEIQRLLGFPDGYLVPTTQRIRGITDNRLHVKGALFLRRRVGSRETRQVVVVPDNTSSLYLSPTALKELNLLLLDFPISASQTHIKRPHADVSVEHHFHRNQIPSHFHQQKHNGLNTVPENSMRHPIVLLSTQQVTHLRTRGKMIACQQHRRNKIRYITLLRQLVYSAQTINSVGKVAFTSIYESDSKLEAIIWERIVAAAATDEEC